MKTSVTDYKKLDKTHAASDSTDRANRGVKAKAWLTAFVFSASFYAAVYFIVHLFKR